MAELQTAYEFSLPRGDVDHADNLPRTGTMRLATAADEIYPLNDPRVTSNQAYLVVLLLARVITRLGALRQIDTGVIEGLFSVDLAYLQDFYRHINENGSSRIPATCPECATRFELDPVMAGGS